MVVKKMKSSTIRLGEDLRMRLNKLKYQFGVKTVDAVIRKLLEMTTKLQTADNFKEKND